MNYITQFKLHFEDIVFNDDTLEAGLESHLCSCIVNIARQDVDLLLGPAT